MENQNQKQDQIETGSFDIKIIGIRKYEYLKTFSPDRLSEDQKKQVELFEQKRRSATPEQMAKTTDYLQSLLEVKPKKEFAITARQLWDLFLPKFQEINERPFIKIPGVTMENMQPIIYYFSKDERFFDCVNLRNDISEPSFEKGLLIIGNFGNGKTSIMKTIEDIFKGVPGFGFKGYTANEVVTMFEKCSGEDQRDEFNKNMFRGPRYFDDVKTERIASNYGKVNIFKDIFEERYSRKSKTFITCNYKDGFKDDLTAAIDEFEEIYGGRVYDRIFEMYNVIEFKGKSFRK